MVAQGRRIDRYSVPQPTLVMSYAPLSLLEALSMAGLARRWSVKVVVSNYKVVICI